ncbi:RAB6-interacting golgin [Falco biarmicus]|uniref:RAB6-interacting golgin n=3 Tax=Falco TaxID=8952 RepID=UPI0018867014|nr:RAB6-interacting golgin isoform X1 [Falco rusticolus]XP_055580919.1 RAB6-interacting golgin isoform X1 [Falco cherrug]XP_055671544.1 RAB6-interacting golgin isoform X1 [Falco peregrinus]XP_056212174.1 RAB6-interacting golgin [Falco biarmicus]
MAEAWAGFSQEELRRLRGQRSDLYDPSEQQHRPHTVNKSRQQLQRVKALQQQCQKLGLQGGAASVPPEQLLSVPKQKPGHPQQPAPPPHPPSAGDQRQSDNRDQQKEVTLVDPGNGSDSAQTHPAKPNSKVEKKKVELQEKSRWEILQQEQRLIEEKNKRKKALLAKAIAERSKRTQAETVKLKRIQKELQALDDMVSADIGILRNRIDQASLDYSYARKRYDKAESEYVAAKLDLQHKTEIKEHLTEHLCTIIQQNELRKARKLEELMQQLEVEADEENLELEIEVERMLQQQEAEAGRQASQSHSHAGTAKENPTPSVTVRKSEHGNHAVVSPAISEQLVQSQNSGTKSLTNMDSQTQAVNVTPGNSPACSAT